MSGRDEPEGRAWDDGAPTFRERLALAVRQSPARGAVIALLFLLSFGFLVAAFVEFWDAVWAAAAGAGAALLAGNPTALLASLALLVAVGVVVLVVRRG